MGEADKSPQTQSGAGGESRGSATGEGTATPDGRNAAVCIERGVERYSEGRYPEALKEFEAALLAQPGHPRAIECLAWTREVVSGKRTLVSGTFTAVEAIRTSSSSDAVVTPPPAQAPLAPVSSAPPPSPPPPTSSTQGFEAPQPKTGRTIQGLPPIDGNPTPARHFEEVPDSVTREWSSSATGRNLPPLDVPELSEEQIANLIEAGGGRGLTLTKGDAEVDESAVTPKPAQAPLPGVSYNDLGTGGGDEGEGDSDSDSDDEESTRVRLEGRVVELIAEAEEPTPEPGSLPRGILQSIPDIEGLVDPLLPPLDGSTGLTPKPEPVPTIQSMSTLPEEGDQTSDEPPSEPTNPFHKKRLHEIAPALMPSTDNSGLHNLPPPPKPPKPVSHSLPSVPAPPAAPGDSLAGIAAMPVGSWSHIRVALDRGDAKDAFNAAELAVADAGGLEAGRAADEQDLLRRVYEGVVGDLNAVPRFGKATPDLDSRSAFLLSRMDGSISADDLLDVSGMRRLEALRVLAQLVAQGVVTMKK